MKANIKTDTAIRQSQTEEQGETGLSLSILCVDPDNLLKEATATSAVLPIHNGEISITTAHTLSGMKDGPMQALFDCTLFFARDRNSAIPLLPTGIQGPLIVVLRDFSDSDAASLISAGASDCLPLETLERDGIGLHVWKCMRHHKVRHAAQQARDESRRNSLYDKLTGLPNRAFFFESLEHAIRQAQRSGNDIAVLIIDLNGLNSVNKNLGYAAGDVILRNAAISLRETLRDSDLIARLGDDEFAALLLNKASLSGAVITASRLAEQLKKPIEYDGNTIALGGCIGVSLYPDHGLNADMLVRRAENAMRKAKANASDFVIYAEEDEIDDTARNSLSLRHDLDRALDEDQITLYYQPKIDTGSGAVAGFEALARWKHPEKGIIPPDVFIPVAEDSGLIKKLTRQTLKLALKNCQHWREAGNDISVSVNISTKVLHDPHFTESVALQLAKFDIPAERLILEITESAIIADESRARQTITRLHSMGVCISIDDFGTGYTPLSFIRKMPVSEIKIDKSFVMTMLESKDDHIIVDALINLGHNLGFSVVAEGVEDKDTLERLADIHCDIAQGYYISRPIPADEVLDWLNVYRPELYIVQERKMLRKA